MQKESEIVENESWMQIGEVLDVEMSSVDDVRFDLEKSFLYNSSIGNSKKEG